VPLIQQGAERKHSLEMLTHIDRIPSCSWWRFVGCTSRAQSSHSTRSGDWGPFYYSELIIMVQETNL